MPLNALIDGLMARALRDGPRSAECFECGAPMVAKTGDLIVWHWAHRAENPECGLSGESEWHLTWKSLGLDGTQEIVSGNGLRRADVLSPAGFAVEFQKSPLSWQEVRDREADWEYRLVWVVETHSGVRTGRITMPDPWTLTWWRCPATVSSMVRKDGGGCRVFLDLGDDHGLFYAASRTPIYRGDFGDEDPGQEFSGFRVDLDAFIANVLHSSSQTALAAMSLRPDLWQPIYAALDVPDRGAA
jgi:hypothetical protein